MTPEKEFNQAVWWTLKEIKLNSLSSPSTQEFYLGIKRVEENGNPTIDNQKRAIEFLTGEKAINGQWKYPFGIDPTRTVLRFKPIGFVFKILQPKFDEFCKLYGNEKTSAIPDIYYHKSGIGFADGKRFKFKNKKPEFFVFEELYKKICKPLKRKQVLELSKFNDTHAVPVATEETLFINDLAKKIRKRTTLTPSSLVNNNGSLTLIGNKIKNPSN